MPDLQGQNPLTGEPTTVPQEAAAQRYREGSFIPEGPIPVKLKGAPTWLSHEDTQRALANGDAELDFDPHGAIKAGALAAARGATMGLSDTLAIQGQRLIGDRIGAEHTRQALKALQDEHPAASAAGELAGSAASLLIPGEQEADIARAPSLIEHAEQSMGALRALQETGQLAEGAEAASRVGQTTQAVSALDKAATPEMVSSLTGAGVHTTGAPAELQALADAQAGRTQGSQIARTLRALNPYEYVGKAGATVEDQLGRVLGDGRAAAIAGPIARVASEGALIAAAQSADESELGDYPLTGEAILANTAQGALWGGAFGLVGVAGRKLLNTAARRTAEKLVAAQMGGTPREMRDVMRRWGHGLFNYALERGYNPTMNGEALYDWAVKLQEDEGINLGRVLADAGRNGDLSAQEVYENLGKALDEPLKRYGFLGVDSAVTKQRILDEFANVAELQKMPEPRTPVTVEEMRLKAETLAGTQRLRAPTPQQIEEHALPALRDQALAAYSRGGLDRIDRAVNDEIDSIVYKQSGNEPVDRTRLDRLTSRRADYVERLEKAEAIRDAAEQDLRGRVNSHNALHDSNVSRIQAALQQQEDHAVNEYQHSIEAVRRSNESARISFNHVRDFRKRVDGYIPWNYVANGDAKTNAAAEMKLAARRAVETQVEEGIDKAAQGMPSGRLGDYLHSKEGYAMSSELVKMAERGRAREVNAFGRPTRANIGGVSGHVMAGVVGALTGHPLGAISAATAYGVGRHYLPRFTAWGLHKAAELASTKASRQELAIGVRRAVRASFGQRVPESLAAYKPANLTPQEMRMTAAQAMEQIYKLANGPTGELRSRLAALNPAAPLVAPQSFAAAEGAFRRQVQYMAMQISPRLLTQMQQGQHLNPNDIPTHEAREFQDHFNHVRDPRLIYDSLGHGTLTATQAQVAKTAWPAINHTSPSSAAFMYRYWKDLDREGNTFLSPRAKTQHMMLFGAKNPAFTLKLQQSAAASVGGVQAAMPGGPAAPKTGMTHAAATSKAMAPMVSLLTTQSQESEAKPAGRRQKGAETPTPL